MIVEKSRYMKEWMAHVDPPKDASTFERIWNELFWKIKLFKNVALLKSWCCAEVPAAKNSSSVDIFILSNSTMTHLCRSAINLTLKFHVQSPSIFHRLWKADPRGKDDVSSTWITRCRFDFQSRWNIDGFSTCFF